MSVRVVYIKIADPSASEQSTHPRFLVDEMPKARRRMSFNEFPGSYTHLVKPNCHQASWEPLSRSYTYAEALILANTVLVRAEANGLHQKRVREAIRFVKP
jgi:hypothetical protein